MRTNDLCQVGKVATFRGDVNDSRLKRGAKQVTQARDRALQSPSAGDHDLNMRIIVQNRFEEGELTEKKLSSKQGSGCRTPSKSRNKIMMKLAVEKHSATLRHRSTRGVRDADFFCEIHTATTHLLHKSRRCAVGKMLVNDCRKLE